MEEELDGGQMQSKNADADADVTERIGESLGETWRTGDNELVAPTESRAVLVTVILQVYNRFQSQP
jgi:hypothetical protein